MYSRVLPFTSMLARPLVRPAGLPHPALGMTAVASPPPVPPGPPRPATPVVPAAPVVPALPLPAPPDVPAPPEVPASPDVPADPAGAPPPMPVDDEPDPPHDEQRTKLARATKAKPDERRWRYIGDLL